MHQPERVGQNHGKGNHRNHISSGTLSSLRARETLLVATNRFLPLSFPTSAVKWKESGDPEPLFTFFIFLHCFFFYLLMFPKYSGRNSRRNEILGVGGFWILSRARLKKILGAHLLSPVPPNPKHVAEPLYHTTYNIHTYHHLFGEELCARKLE